MQRLREFYTFKDKLIYASKHFLGYNPQISISLEKPSLSKEITEYNLEHNFVMENEEFNALLIGRLSFGPIRGFQRIEINRNGQQIISYEIGGRGHGSNYSKGQNYFMEKNKAYLIVEGWKMKYHNENKIYGNLNSGYYYLLIFKDVTVPIIYPIKNIEPGPAKEIYSKEEHESYKHILWEGTIQTSAIEIKVLSSIIPPLRFPNPTIGQKLMQHAGYKKIEFFINEEYYFF